MINGKLRGEEGFTGDDKGIDPKKYKITDKPLKAILVGVDFSDAQSKEAPEGFRNVKDYYDFLVPGALDWFTKSSTGQVKLTVAYLESWFRMSKSHLQYGFERGISFDEHFSYIKEAAKLVSKEVDLREYDIFYIVPPKNASGIKFSPTLIDDKTSQEDNRYKIKHAVTFGQDMWRWGFKVLNHETLHIFGIPDLYSYAETENYSNKDQKGGNRERAHGYVGEWDLMGLISGTGPDLFSWNKWRLGWLKDDQVTLIDKKGSHIVDLIPIEHSVDGKKMVILPFDESSGLALESRRSIGLDSTVPLPGILVYLIHADVGGGKGTIKVLPENWGLDHPKEPSLSLNNRNISLKLKSYNLTINLLESKEDSDRVEIKVD